MLIDFQRVNSVRKLTIFPGLLDTRTKKRVLQCDAVPIATRGIDNLTGRDRAVGINPVSPSPAVGSRGVGDLLAITVSSCW